MIYTNTKKGFTLAELMAVVAIIAIIAAIGLGSYRKSTDRAIFSDGLAGAHALAAAYDEYYYEHGSYPNSMLKIPVGLANQTGTASSITTRYFVYTWDSTGKFIKASRLSGDYYLKVYAESAAANNLKSDECVGVSGTNGADFCSSMGY